MMTAKLCNTLNGDIEMIDFDKLQLKDEWLEFYNEEKDVISMYERKVWYIVSVS